MDKKMLDNNSWPTFSFLPNVLKIITITDIYSFMLLTRDLFLDPLFWLF